MRRSNQPRAAIGGCGCGAQPNQPCLCTPVPGGGPGMVPPYPGGGPGNFAAPDCPAGTFRWGDGSCQPTPPPVPLLFPPAFDIAGYQRWWGQNMPQVCIPYKDAIRDCLLMSSIASARTAVSIGATTNVTVSPDRGLFDAYYIQIVARLADGTVVEDFLVTPPTIEGCPAPCSVVPQDGTWWDELEGCCCGRPFRAIVGNLNGEATPLVIPITNLNAAAITVQVLLRGFCHRQAICL